MGLRYDEPDAGPPVATDFGADEQYYQVEKIAFGAPGSPAETIRVEHSVPLPARDYHGGLEAYDTGILPVPSSMGSIGDAVSLWLDAMLLGNLTDANQQVIITDGDDEAYASPILQPGELRVVPLFGFRFSNGVKMSASDGAVTVQLKGTRL